MTVADGLRGAGRRSAVTAAAVLLLGAGAPVEAGAGVDDPPWPGPPGGGAGAVPLPGGLPGTGAFGGATGQVPATGTPGDAVGGLPGTGTPGDAVGGLPGTGTPGDAVGGLPGTGAFGGATGQAPGTGTGAVPWPGTSGGETGEPLWPQTAGGGSAGNGPAGEGGADPAAGGVPAAGTRSFRDEFTGRAGSAPSASKWRQLTGCRWGHGAEKQCYTAGGRNARLDGAGHLVINARREKYVGADGVSRRYTSARLVSRVGRAGGTLRVRAKLSRRQAGAWPAIWLLGTPEAKTPHYGEIDLMENGLNGAAWDPEYHVHTSGPGSGAGGAYGVDATRWHVYEVRWTTGPSGRAWFRIDGRLMRVLAYRVPSGSSAEVILNIAVGSQAGRPAVDLDSTMTVDYVRMSG
ncbi:glycoside hydrolase family 16 protein [Planomonospora sp. ID82291]|uniref:glycoside hydrolase family 16 protein n=1 Tax=Planomonospora sp. ID82291 TaxID=2738136 RepID=UPI0018C404AA|nr:glycoside hydrolase family 16 protein [Planomonospora sp. ID82291]MBG0813908.1 glycoside hydrolase family 16 protein [Planomonospora sp. ID82291]